MHARTVCTYQALSSFPTQEPGNEATGTVKVQKHTEVNAQYKKAMNLLGCFNLILCFSGFLRLVGRFLKMLRDMYTYKPQTYSTQNNIDIRYKNNTYFYAQENLRDAM